MLSEAQYKLLEPHRADIMSKSMNRAGSYMIVANTIKQQMGMGEICFACDGSKIEAMNDMYNLMVEYENNVKSKG